MHSNLLLKKEAILVLFLKERSEAASATDLGFGISDSAICNGESAETKTRKAILLFEKEAKADGQQGAGSHARLSGPSNRLLGKEAKLVDSNLLLKKEAKRGLVRFP